MGAGALFLRFFEDWRPGSWWNAKWIPFLQFNHEEYVCVDVPGALGHGRGAVFVRENADPRRVVLAPSVHAWLHHHVEITAAGPPDAEDDAWCDHFESPGAQAIRARLDPGFPRYAVAEKR